tara:strand:+ start:5588 stop:6055 length:468 start_codon:yes stop_codon:yes gene_type:complete
MKLSISKDLSENDDLETLREILTSKHEVELTFYDTSIDGKFEGSDVIPVDFEDRKMVHVLALKLAVSKSCQASLFIPKHVTPLTGMVDELLTPIVNDENISATHSDYSVDGIQIIQNSPIAFCRRLEPGVENQYDLQQTKGIVHYVPLSLYNVKS